MACLHCSFVRQPNSCYSETTQHANRVSLIFDGIQVDVGSPTSRVLELHHM